MKVTLKYIAGVREANLEFYTFFIEGISRGCLQEVVRHEAVFSVKSTRYTLKELKGEIKFKKKKPEDFKRAEKYLVMTGDIEIDRACVSSLEKVRKLLLQNKSNDKVKYALPESYKTTLTMTISREKLDNFLKLRLSKDALWEIRELAEAIQELIKDKNE